MAMNMDTHISVDHAVRRAQLYLFLSSAFMYPEENWTDDWQTVTRIANDLNISLPEVGNWNADLDTLQSEYSHSIGLTGPLCYETEYGLPHEFRHSQELADIAGFYNAFGFSIGGTVHERPDHLSVELEFLYILSLKEAYAIQKGMSEQAEICIDAQRKFLHDHIGHWINWFAASLANLHPNSRYAALAQVAVTCVNADMARLGVQIEERQLAKVRPTPLGPELSCQDCTIAEPARPISV
jgi:DMSO reductase family type II enzyme chaperone